MSKINQMANPTPLSRFNTEEVDYMVNQLEREVHGTYGNKQVPNALKEKAQAIANIIDDEGLRDEIDYERNDAAYKAFFGWLQRHNPFDEKHKEFKHNKVDAAKAEFETDKKDWSKVVKMQDLLTLSPEDRDALFATTLTVRETPRTGGKQAWNGNGRRWRSCCSAGLWRAQPHREGRWFW